MSFPASAVERPTTAAPACPIRVLLADDHAVTLWGLQQLVQSAQPRMTVSGTASTCTELMAHPALAQTDVVLLDLRLGDANAIHSVAKLVSEVGVKVVLLTGDLNPSHHREAVMRGARGVVLKSEPTERILDAIQRVHAGEVCLNGTLMAMLLGAVPGLPAAKPAPKDDNARRIDSLTPKERQVIESMVKHRGAKSLVVAEALGMSENTLRNHLTVIYSKLGVQGKLNLYVFAVQHRITSDAANDRREASSVAGNSQWGGMPSVWSSLN